MYVVYTGGRNATVSILQKFLLGAGTRGGKQKSGNKLMRKVAESLSLETLKSNWSWCWATYRSWPCFSGWLDQDNLQRSFPISVFQWPCEVALSSALPFYSCGCRSSPSSQMKRLERSPLSYTAFCHTFFPKTFASSRGSPGFLVHSWFLNYNNYYSMFYFRMNKMTIYQNCSHDMVKGIPFVLFIINTLHCSVFFLSFALL